MNDQLLLVGCTFGAVTLVAYLLSRLMLGSGDDRLRSRLTGPAAAGQRPQLQTMGGLKGLLQRIGQSASSPFMPKTREKQSGLRRKLGYAGLYSPQAVRVVTGCKVIGLAAGLGLGYLVGTLTGAMLLSVSLGGLISYMLPPLWLKARIKQNQKALTYGLADGLDLMLVCVEAGLTIDSAMQRVGQELAMAHPAMARELNIAHMETRVGVSRAEALRNLGVRTGCPGLQSLAAMLIQADRFGTSIGSALRIHAESLRLTRQNAAEEIASKAAVKMSFPLVLFIFPATFIVLAGPTAIAMLESPLFK